MFALINTMTKIDGDSIGTVVSLHRSIEAAEEADRKLQKAIKRNNGPSSYLPTVVAWLSIKYVKGQHVSPSDAAIRNN